MHKRAATCCWIACGLWLAWWSTAALAQSTAVGPLATPFEAEPLPDELTVIDGFTDPAPQPPLSVVSGPLGTDELGVVHEEELTPVVELSSGTWLRNGLSYVEADVVMLQHNSHNKINLASDATTGSNRQLDVERGALGLSANMRINVGQNLFRDGMNRDHAVEFMFYGLGDWSAEGSLTPATPNFIRSDIDPFIGGFNGANEQTFRYVSDLDSYELNYRLSWRLGRDQMVLQPGGDWVRQASPGTLFSMLAGVRVVQIDERFNYTSVSTQPDLRRGQITVLTNNDLVGGQVGGLWMQQYANWNWGVSGKGGAYVNFTSMNADLLTVDPVLLELDREVRVEEDVLAFIGELSVFCRYHLQPNISLRAGYEALWTNQIAQATEQLFVTPGPVLEVETGGSPFFMGMSFGFEATW